MNRLMIVLLVIYLCSQVNGLQLYSICPNSTFEYKGLEVNSFLQKNFNFTLEKIGTYAIDEEYIDVDSLFTRKEDRDDFQEVIDNYHSYLVNLYSEDFFFNANDRIENYDLEIIKIKEMRNKLTSFGKKAGQKWNKIDTAVEPIDKLTDEYFGYIRARTKSRLTRYTWSLKNFKYFIDNLDINPKTETFVFKNDFLNHIYKREMVQLEKFYFIKGSEKYYDLNNSYGIFQVSVNIPFNTKELREQPSCFESNKLPPFFANKTET